MISLNVSAVVLVRRENNRIQLRKPHRKRIESMNGAERKITRVIEPLISTIRYSKKLKKNKDELLGMVKSKRASRPKLFNSLFYQGYEPVDAKNTALNEVVPGMIPNRTIEEAWVLIIENFGIAESIVKRYCFDMISGITHKDAVHILVEYSLFETALFFDESKGNFSTYAYSRTDNCRNEIIRRGGQLKFSVNMIEKIGRLLYHSGKNPDITDEKLAEAVGVKPKNLERLKVAAKLRSPGSVLGGDTCEHLANKKKLKQFALDPGSDVLTMHNPEEEAIRNDMIQILETALAGLSKREAKIIRMHHGIGCKPKTLNECAKKFNISRERVRQIEVKALQKIRRRFDYLRECLD